MLYQPDTVTAPTRPDEGSITVIVCTGLTVDIPPRYAPARHNQVLRAIGQALCQHCHGRTPSEEGNKYHCTSEKGRSYAGRNRFRCLQDSLTKNVLTIASVRSMPSTNGMVLGMPRHYRGPVHPWLRSMYRSRIVGRLLPEPLQYVSGVASVTAAVQSALAAQLRWS